MRTVDIILAWLLIGFGAVHLSLTRKVHPDLDINAVWFAGGGVLIIAIGALNLLRVAYSSIAKGAHVVSVIANIVILAVAQARNGNYEEGVAAANRCPDDAARKATLGMVNAISRKRDEACAVLRELVNEQGASPKMRYAMACIHAELGQLDDAFECLAKALEGRTVQLVYLAADPCFDSLRDDPRWRDLLRNVGLMTT